MSLLFAIEKHVDTLVAGLAQGQSVVYVKPPLRVGVEGAKVVRVRGLAACSAYPTGIIVALKNGCSPLLEVGRVAQILYFARFAAAAIGQGWKYASEHSLVSSFRPAGTGAKTPLHASLSGNNLSAPLACNTLASGVGIMHKSVMSTQEAFLSSTFIGFWQQLSAPATAWNHLLGLVPGLLECTVVKVALMVLKPAAWTPFGINGEGCSTSAGAGDYLLCIHRPIIPQTVAGMVVESG